MKKDEDKVEHEDKNKQGEHTYNILTTYKQKKHKYKEDDENKMKKRLDDDVFCLFCFSNYHGNNTSTSSSSLWPPSNRKQSLRRANLTSWREGSDSAVFVDDAELSAES
ncbi:hypothetical protein PAMP_009875 [Pampus punctatissimus]